MIEKILKNEIYKCSSCGGNLIFSPKDQELKCENCSRIFEIGKQNFKDKHTFLLAKEKEKEYLEWTSANKVFTCKNCGAKIIMKELEIAKVCAYCHSPYIVQEDELPGLVPDAVIPFKIDDKMASSHFAKNAKARFFVPREFKKKMPESEIKKFYVPAFSFDANSSSVYSGILERDETTFVKDGPPIVQVYSKSISGTKQCQHKNVVVETSSKLSQEEIQGILPYDFEEAVRYNNAFISGYSVEYYANALNDCKSMADKIMKDSITQEILSEYSYSRVESFNLKCKFENEKYCYDILPIYKFDFDYKKKKYSCLMNGQTGKLGGGLPIAVGKIVAIVAFVALVILAGILISQLQ
ncbi:MAG: hypothetical protein RR400_00590 [Clostridia bacterium]